MKVNRSVKCSLRFANKQKSQMLDSIRQEYTFVVNAYIDLWWEDAPVKAELIKAKLDDGVNTWFSQRMKLTAAREAVDMITSARRTAEQRNREALKPVHTGKRMAWTSNTASLVPSKTPEFDAWLQIRCIGNGIKLDIPIRFHKQFNKWNEQGHRLNSYVILEDAVQFTFEIETGPKQAPDHCVGIDTGIKKLATLSTGKKLGQDIEQIVAKIKRRKWGSKGQQKARAHLRQRMGEVAKIICGIASLVVVEDLRQMNHKTKVKRRLTKNMRRSLGAWAYSYWLDRLQMTTEETNVSFRRCQPFYTSQRCNACGHTERSNRNGENFLCRNCGHADDADVNAAKNILERFLTGKYGSGCKALMGQNAT